MKANEQARGEGLVAVPVKIDAGYFLIALNNLEQAAATNKRLLLEFELDRHTARLHNRPARPGGA